MEKNNSREVIHKLYSPKIEGCYQKLGLRYFDSGIVMSDLYANNVCLRLQKIENEILFGIRKDKLHLFGLGSTYFAPVLLHLLNERNKTNK